MTAFLFLPATLGTPVTRRVDLRDIPSLFGEDDEPLSTAEPGRRKLLDTILAVLTAIGVVGDLMLVGHPDRVAADVASPHSILSLAPAPARPGQSVFAPADGI